MVQKVSIVGIGCTKFGSVLTDPELKGLTFQEMVAEAAFEAMDDADIPLMGSMPFMWAT